MKSIEEQIQSLKEEKNAVILAHIYQRPEVQDIADYVGDSLALAQIAAKLDNPVIVFCGVTFMAETAAILSPKQKVLLPEIDAGCPMAMMATAQDVLAMKQKYPEAKVVTYVNSTVEVKAVSDICCTSSNASKVVKSLAEKEIIFVPDQNLGAFVQKQVPEKTIHLWPGFCPTHQRILPQHVAAAKKEHPGAKVLAHPECRPAVLELADFIGSTAQITNYAHEDKDQEYIICTEEGVLHQMTKNDPEKKFYMVSSNVVCPNMKKTTLASILRSLRTETNHIKVDENIAQKARKAITAMLKVS